MDPFTEKLLERTRARRENLQKKLSERPAPAGRPVVKRLREPLGETNSVTIQSATDNVPQTSTKPSPSKRKCSGENLQPAADEENQEPVAVHSTAALLSDPPTDRKPPVCPGSSRPSSAYSSLERTSTRAAVQPEPEKMITSTPPARSREVQQEAPQQSGEVQQEAPQRSGEVQQQALQRSREVQEEEPAPSSTGMRSRLQRLAQQRRGWDGDETVEDCPPLSVLSRPAEVPAAVAPVTSSGTPVGRKGRLAHLAATIGSWEDDLSHANIPKEKESAPASHKGAVSRAHGATSSSAAHSKFAPKSNQQSSGLGAPASPQKTPASFQPPSSLSQSSSSTSSSMTQRTPASLHPPSSSTQSSVSSSNPQKTPTVLPSSTSVPQSPLKTQTRSTGPNITSSPQRSEVQSKPAPQEKPSAGAPGVKSFLERFEERCQETRTPVGGTPHTRTPVGGAPHTRTPVGGTPHTRTPVGGAPHTRTPTGTPNTRLVQDRLKVAQSANTSSAELTQRQKLERESELALIRNRFQKGDNIWKNNNNERPQNKASTDRQLGPSNGTVEVFQEPSNKPAEREERASEDEPTTQTTSEASTGPGLTCPPVSTSSPLRSVLPSEKDTEEPRGPEEGKETSEDQSINSAVINQLFEGVLDQTEAEDEDEEEEEDGLNISSMSLLTPLVETVAAVVKSPEKRLMTSTPANSFLVKSNTPEHGSRSSLAHSSSSDSVEIYEGDLRLPYSIDAYRSTRVKETERPNIKQVIVRKEDVSQRGGEPRGASHFNIKQKMKILTSEMNLQQTVIHQASQALNCCTDEEHGKGSQVEAEAERLLLVATERREALKRELDRLHGKPAAAATQDPAATAASRGSISLTEVRLPLKADFVCSTANRPESTKHSFFIMIRADAEHTVASPLASTHRGLSGDTLTFPTKFTLPDASSDFEIDLEVYCLTQKRELCIDKKKKTNKSKAITPKRFLAITKTAQTPVVASPGGPNAVRTSNFVLVGSHKISLSSIGKNKFPLEKVPFLCPLEGHIFLKLQCDVGSKVEERGFLTMFEDVSGFGAWHRRWCVLSGYFISYWTYPDDEKRKNPIGRINLASCTSRAVEPANREFCARPNTMELITARPQREDDKETLVSQCTDTMCVTKNWLSADTKDERNLWMKKLNQILTDLRMWQPDACYRPQ